MEKRKIMGKSFVINLLSVFFNITGLCFLIIGYHNDFVDNQLINKSIGYSLIFISTIIFLIFRGFYLMSYVARVIIGGLFIVSGLIKANDPLGFSYKLEEYFEDGALAYRIKEMGWESFSLENLMSYALIISIVVCITEIVLGVAVILGTKIKLAFWSLLIMMLFFTLLTWHTKSCNPYKNFVLTEYYSNDENNIEDSKAIKMYQNQISNGDEMVQIKNLGNETKVFITKPVQCVNDCGCFGDALKGSVGRSLTPQESFWKDIVLLYLVVFIGISMKHIKNNSFYENLIMIPISLLIVVFFSWIFGWYFPILFSIVVIFVPLLMSKIRNNYLRNDIIKALSVVILSLIFVIYVLLYLPSKDYRPYAVGESIIENMITKKEPKYESISVYENIDNGSIKEFSMIDSMNYILKGKNQKVPTWQVIMDFEKDHWKWKESKNKEIDPGIPAKIMDLQYKKPIHLISDDVLNHHSIRNTFKRSDFYNSYYVLVPKDSTLNIDSVLVSDFDSTYYPTIQYSKIGPVEMLKDIDLEVNLLPYILSHNKQIVIVMNKMYMDSSDIENDNLLKLNSIHYPSQSEIRELKFFLDQLNDSYNILIFVSDSKENIDAFKKKNGLEKYEFSNSIDDKELKIMNRSIPGILFLHKGIVKGKWSINNVPKTEELEKLIKK